MFVISNNTLFNLDKIEFVRINRNDITIGLATRNYLLKYENEDLAKKAYSEIRIAIVKDSSIVDISESKLKEVI